MPTVYGVALSPFVRKVRVALAEKRVAYDLDPVVPVNVSPEYRKISPLGKVPAFRDGDKTLADSSVILAYLERIHPNPPLYPSDPYDYARALWFEEYADGGLVTIIGPKIFFPKVVAPRFFNQKTDEAMVQKAFEEELPPMLDYLESELAPGAATLVGRQFTVGDIGVASQFVNLFLAGFGVDARRWPKLAAYLSAVHERPSFRSSIAEERAMLGV
ncbi:MAG: glutathione S-transferase family protein [Deltaproteobacteria bacterium]|nr:glutathione S-transferase family protein [Deltaproteobacteria bacterium]